MSVTPSAISRAMRRGFLQLGLASLARRADSRDDPAAGPRDLLIGDAVQSRLELAAAASGVDDVGVAIDEAWRHPAPRSLNGRQFAIVGRQLVSRPDPCDPAVPDNDRAVTDFAIGACAIRHGRDV